MRCIFYQRVEKPVFNSTDDRRTKNEADLSNLDPKIDTRDGSWCRNSHVRTVPWCEAATTKSLQNEIKSLETITFQGIFLINLCL